MNDFGRLWIALELNYGADGRSRTGTGVSPLPPQDSVSTNSTTSAFEEGLKNIVYSALYLNCKSISYELLR